jgi:hydrogenase expression/formation protein HypC
MRIVEVHGATAVGERRGARARIDTLLIEPPRRGDYVLTFQGRAIRMLAADEAAAIDAALDALQLAVLDPAAVAALFPDLDRAPVLPPHLRENA